MKCSGCWVLLRLQKRNRKCRYQSTAVPDHDDQRPDEDDLDGPSEKKAGGRTAQDHQAFSCRAHICGEQRKQKNRKANRGQPGCCGNQQTNGPENLQNARHADQ